MRPLLDLECASHVLVTSPPTCFSHDPPFCVTGPDLSVTALAFRIKFRTETWYITWTWYITVYAVLSDESVNSY